jgi:hypothetical protein
VNTGERMRLDLLGVENFRQSFDLYQWLHALSLLYVFNLAW